jgi:RimJ/RimL family protein N-acetyltransferase
LPDERLTSGAVVLRRWESGDVDTLYDLVDEARDRISPWMAWAADPYTRDDAAAYVTRCASNWAAGEVYSYAITVNGVAVGACGMERNEVPFALEIGYWLHPSHTGHGYATAAAGLLVGEAFALEWVSRVQIWHDAANTASAGIPRRLGFTEVDRRSPPRERLTSGELGVDVIWELTRPSR